MTNDPLVGTLFSTPAPAHLGTHEQLEIVNDKIRQDPSNAGLYLRRGDLHREHKDWRAAFADFRTARRLDPELKAVDFVFGRTALEAGRPKYALRFLNRFLAPQAAHARALELRGRALAQLGCHQEAAADFTLAIAALGPDQKPPPEYYLERAAAWAAAGDPFLNQALRGLDEGIARLGPLVTLELRAIELELQRKNYDRALRRVDRISEGAARQETWLARRGEILEKAERWDAARQAYQQALAALETLPTSRRRTRSMTELKQRLQNAIQRLASKGK